GRGVHRPAARAVPAVTAPGRDPGRPSARRCRRYALRIRADRDGLGRRRGGVCRGARGALSRRDGDAAPRLRGRRGLKLPWDLELGQPFVAPYSKLVAPVRLPDGTEAVLKIHLDEDTESLQEPEALRFWNGEGAVRLIDHDPETKAMLIER